MQCAISAVNIYSKWRLLVIFICILEHNRINKLHLQLCSVTPSYASVVLHSVATGNAEWLRNKIKQNLRRRLIFRREQCWGKKKVSDVTWENRKMRALWQTESVKVKTWLQHFMIPVNFAITWFYVMMVWLINQLATTNWLTSQQNWVWLFFLHSVLHLKCYNFISHVFWHIIPMLNEFQKCPCWDSLTRFPHWSWKIRHDFSVSFGLSLKHHHLLRGKVMRTSIWGFTWVGEGEIHC